MTSNDVIRSVHPISRRNAEGHQCAAGGRLDRGRQREVQAGRAEHGHSDSRCRWRIADPLRPNGGAVPGDRIVGILTAGEGITIYPIQSPDLKAFDDEPERWLDVRWDVDEAVKNRFPAKLRVTVVNEPGALADVARVMGDTDANIDALQLIDKGPDFRDMMIDVESGT